MSTYALVLTLGIVLGAVVLFAALSVLERRARRGRREQLETFARGLEGGSWTDEEVEGRFQGRVLVVRLERPDDAPPRQVFELQVANAAAELAVDRADGLDGDPHEAATALRALLAPTGFDRVEVRAGWLRLERPGIELDPAYLQSAARRMSELAAQFERRPIPAPPTASDVANLFVWTAGGKEARCPSCRAELDTARDMVEACGVCGTLHHRDCLSADGGCAVFACRGRGSERGV